MIYFGVDLYPKSFNIVCLTDCYALIDRKYFEFDKLNKFRQWIQECKSEPHEICQWFFDEKKYNDMDDPDSIFHFSDEYHDNSNYVYLVNHRKLINLIQFLYEWIIHEYDFFGEINKAFILASSFRIFEQDTILITY